MEKRNAEGYYSPTEYEALRNVRKSERGSDFRFFSGYRPLVYICSPYAGDVHRNRANARKYSRFALEKNAIPLTPHLLYPQFMNDADPAERWLARHRINYVLIGKCDELWVFGGVISSGMEHEIEIATKRKMKIRYFTAEMEEQV